MAGVKILFGGKRKFITILVAIVVGLMFLLLIVGVSSPSKTQNVVRQESSTKPDVAGVQVEPSNTPIRTVESTRNPDTRQASLIKVVDGDTIAVSIKGKIETVRIIGIDSAEVINSRKTVECFGKEASDFATVTLQDNKTLFLEFDPTQGERDKYQRLLRYVWIKDGFVDFGKLMVTEGFASEYTYNLPYKYQSEYKQAEKEARLAKKGLWADNACDSANTSEEDKDCSDFKVHDEAQTYFEGKGGSSTNNVDRLDSDHDGIACESLP